MVVFLVNSLYGDILTAKVSLLSLTNCIVLVGFGNISS